MTGLTTDQMTGPNATDNMDGFGFPEDGEGTWHVTDSTPRSPGRTPIRSTK